MSRIKPEKSAHPNVLMRKENQEVKRTKDWQWATTSGILFASLIPFCSAILRMNHFFISYNFSFDRKDHIFLTCLSRWGSGRDSGNCIGPLGASRTNNMPLVQTLSPPEMLCSWLMPKLSTRKKPAWLARFPLWVSSPGTPRTVHRGESERAGCGGT